MVHVLENLVNPSKNCGSSEDQPCSNVSQALLKPGDDLEVLYVGSQSPQRESCNRNMTIVNKSVTLRGKYHGTILGCQKSQDQADLFSFVGTKEKHITVQLKNLEFVNAIIFAWRTDMTISNCTFRNSRLMFAKGDSPVNVTIEDTYWYGTTFCNGTGNCIATAEVVIAGYSLNLKIKSSQFFQTKINVSCTTEAAVLIRDSKFSNDLQYKPVHAGFVIRGSHRYHSKYEIFHTTFENQLNPDPILAVRNLYDAALLIKALSPLARMARKSNVTLLLESVTFRNNERGLTLIGAFQSIKIRNCIFKENIAMHHGAGLLALTLEGTTSYLYNTTFDTNAAGTYRKEILDGFKDSFWVKGNEVRIESECCKGVVSFVGKGGAIRIIRGGLILDNCLFVNNTARLLGGAIFVDRESDLQITETQFRNIDHHIHSMQGDVLYSNGKVKLDGAKFDINDAFSHVAILRHSGDHWSMNVTWVEIRCPVGHRLRLTNTSAYGVAPEGLRRSYLLDQLSYFCESCPRNKYSLDYGYLNFNLTNKEKAYFTLLINGSQPQTSYPGSFMYQDITCVDCPYGGRCLNGITAVPNFWGYQLQQTIKFQHCPKGYCCTSTQCEEYHTCAPYRSGPLCSRCIEGHSEALFSSHCVPDKTCSPKWLWPVALASGALYALFLLFQKDMRDFMFVHQMKITDLPLRFRSKSKSAHQGVHPDEEMTVRPLTVQTDDACDGDKTKVILTTVDKPEKEINDLSAEVKASEPEAEAPPDTGATFLIILFYYFQDAQLLHVKTVFATAENKSKSMLKVVLSGLFKFRLELFQFMEKVCFIPRITPVTKLLIKTVLVPYVIVLFILMYILYKICMWYKNSCRSQLSTRKNQNGHVISDGASDEANKPAEKTFLTKLSTGYILAMLFTYQKLATTSFALLNCVPIGNQSVLFIDASITCYQPWQWGVMGYAGGCIVLFSFILLIGPGLVKDNMISLFQFFTGCFFPPPFLMYWVCLRLSSRKSKKAAQELTPEEQTVIAVLQGPFKEYNSKLFGPLCGAGLLIGRRLVLVLLFTFVNDILVRLLCMILVCFIILLHHVHALPYKDLKGNIAGSASAAALLIVGGINLVRAGFEAAEYIPQGPNEYLMYVFEEIENAVMLWFPLCVMIVIIISLTFKIAVLIIKRIMPEKNIQNVEQDQANVEAHL